MIRFRLPPGPVRVLLGTCACLALASCAGSEEATPAPDPEPGLGFRKRQMLMAVDDAIHRLMGTASEEVHQIITRYREGLDEVPTPVQLVIPHPVLENYGQEEVAVFAERVERLRETTRRGLDDVLARYEAAFWKVAGEAGRREQGSDLDTRSGYRELDAKVESALAQLYRTAGVESVEQMATFRKTDRIQAVREIQETMEDVGILSQYLSPPLPIAVCLGVDQAPPGLNEARAQVIAFEPSGAGLEAEWEFVQARRTKVQKGGIVVHQTPWRLDPGLPDGRVPLVALEGSPILASRAHFPRPDVTHPDFAALRDHILILEFRTALCRKDTQEVVKTIGWQVVWGVDYRGQTRILAESSVERLLEGDTVIPLLLDPDALDWGN